MEENKKVEPIILQYENGNTYTLEFNRETVKMAERAGFDPNNIASHAMTQVPVLFFYSFMMHHPSVSREKTDKILFEDLGGVSEAISSRLSALYTEPYKTLFNETGEVKNSKLTVLL